MFLKRKNFRENVMTGGKRKYIYLLMRRVVVFFNDCVDLFTADAEIKTPSR